MLVSVAMLLLLLLLLGADRGHGAPRARSSSSRDEATTRSEDLVTDTESGRVRGIRHRARFLPRPVDAYLGIPFAKPPLNALRFRPPQPIEKWRNIYNATRQPNSCYQLHDTVFGNDFNVCISFPFHFTRMSHFFSFLPHEAYATCMHSAIYAMWRDVCSAVRPSYTG